MFVAIKKETNHQLYFGVNDTILFSSHLEELHAESLWIKWVLVRKWRCKLCCFLTTAGQSVVWFKWPPKLHCPITTARVYCISFKFRAEVVRKKVAGTWSSRMVILRAGVFRK